MSRPADPYLNVHFRVSAGEEKLLDCAECTGLSLEVATEEYHEGGQNAFSYKVPTAASVPNLVLKRGITHSSALWEWFATYVDEGTIELRDGQVELLAIQEDEEKAVRVWSFTGAYPVKWTGPELNSMSAGVAFETVELVHRGVRLVEQ